MIASLILKEPQGNLSFAYSLSDHRFAWTCGLIKEVLSDDSILPEQIAGLIHEDFRDEVRIMFFALLEGEFIGSVKTRLSTAEERWLQITPFLVESNDGKMLFGTVTDITDEQQSQYTLHKYANKKNSILNLLTHDLRGPLAIANDLNTFIKDNTGDSNLAEASTHLSRIINQSIDLINDLTQREFLETVESSLIKNRINIASKLQEYIDECRSSDHLAKRNFNYSAYPQEIFIAVDESKFIQIINNLVSNALKFTYDGGIISLTVYEQEKSVLFKFSDNGIGIPGKFKDEIFERFTKARRTGLKGEPSIGLGLSIVKTIVEWHNGRIWFESVEGSGTTFFIEIPMKG